MGGKKRTRSLSRSKKIFTGIRNVRVKGSIAIVIILLLLIGLGVAMVGGLKYPYKENNQNPLGSNVMCCDTGNGDSCHARTDKTLEYNGKQYGLIKSNIVLREGYAHLKDSGLTNSEGDPIILNVSDGLDEIPDGHKCGGPDDDQLVGPGPGDGICVPIPNDSIVYVCKENCAPHVPVDTKDEEWCNKILFCYGSPDSIYDAYYSFEAEAAAEIPDIIRNCEQYVEENVNESGQLQQIAEVSDPQKPNLQLNTFLFERIISWLSPWCKPAVYLYPEAASFINVKVVSENKLTYTDPLYPVSGWNVLADSAGTILHNGEPYDYLYYETEVPDKDIEKPTDGFVVTNAELESLFKRILPRLGLNIRETNQFSEYWLDALPDSPYYFVGIIKQTNLDKLASLDINPKPTTTIRVTLYFEMLNESYSIQEPIIQTPARTGFTVVEWGGIFKKNANTKFSCFQ